MGPAAVHQENLQLLTGPELTKRTRRFTVFMHGLCGYYIWSTTYLGGSISNDERGIVLGTGGGVDINVTSFLALRPIGLDYIPSRISPSASQSAAENIPVAPSLPGSWYRNLRISVGLILKSAPE